MVTRLHHTLQMRYRASEDMAAILLYVQRIESQLSRQLVVGEGEEERK
jgi:hypothetical protein